MADIVTGAPRERVQCQLTDGRIFEAPPDTPLRDVRRASDPQASPPIVAAIVNGRLRELTFPVRHDSEVTWLSSGTTDGARIYRRSVEFLMLVGRRRGVSRRRGLGGALGDDGRGVLLRGARPRAVHPGRSARPSKRGCARSSPPTSRSSGWSRRRTKPSRCSASAARLDKVGLLTHRARDEVILYRCAGAATTSRATWCRRPAACSTSRCTRSRRASCCSSRTSTRPRNCRP